MAIHESCHLIVVAGGKGGVGKSVFAANFAVAVMQEMRAPVLLVDLDSKSCGDQNVITGLRPIKTVKEVATFDGAINQQNLKNIVTPHPSGLHYIGAVLTPDQTLSVRIDLFRQQLAAISQHYRYVVVDVGSEMEELQMSVIEDCSVVLVVTTPEILVVNQTRRLVARMMAATVPSDLLQIVLNKVSPSSLSSQSVTQALGRPIIGLLPADEVTTAAALQRSMPFMLSHGNSPLAGAYRDTVRKLTGGVLQKLKALTRPTGLGKRAQAAQPFAVEGGTRPQLVGRQRSGKHIVIDDPLTLLKMKIHTELINEMDLKKDLTKTQGDPEKEKELRDKTRQIISQLTDRLGQGLPREERSKVIKQVLDEALGLGPLEELLADSNVTEIMVNGAKQIYVERAGKLTLSAVTFTSNLQLRNVIERIVTPLGRRIDEKTPYVDARLQDGSRVNAVIEPLAIDGPSLTIRKFPEKRITIEDYVNSFNSMTQPMADFLRICVEEGLNVIISGGTGSGKTTLLNALSGFIPSNERIVTVEDAAELQLKQEHVVRLETRPANMEGAGEVSIRDLVRNSLRMRPDRIVVGECRDGAALDMLSAMNTGHDGSMTTVHANNPREAISRLETLCLMAGMELPVRAIREQIAGAVDLIVQIGRLSDGSRKVKSITEVVGMQGDTVTLAEIFRFKETGFDKNRKIVGQFQAMGHIPTFIEEFEQRGLIIPRNMFTTNDAVASGASDVKKAATLQRPVTPLTQAVKPAVKRPAGGSGTGTGSGTGSGTGTGTTG